MDRAPRGAELPAQLGRDEARAVGVREQRVVVLRQSAARPASRDPAAERRAGRAARDRARRETSAGVARADRRRRASRSVATSSRCRRRSRAEGAQVAHDDLVDRGLGLQRASQPGLRRRRADLARLTPDAARIGQDGVEVDARAGRSVRRWRRSSASSTGCMSGRSSRQSSALTRWIVARITTIRTTARSSSSCESSSGANPAGRDHSPRYGLCGDLRLHPDEVLDRLARRHRRALVQQLACERRPVERARAEDLGAHRSIVAARGSARLRACVVPSEPDCSGLSTSRSRSSWRCFSPRSWRAPSGCRRR